MKCGSAYVMAGVEVRDRGSNGAVPLRVHIDEPEPPDHGFIWKRGSSSGTVRAWICAACGYTELYTDNLAALYDSYRKSHP
ncbi:hypothetical protein [Sphaerisporangium perillae]|uniref:hypothetical protein n=1 Tax=Sphaerisporangium perillae TaxID=2935860 RepID=UPI00200E53F6|nr:hypothetical protein [Sphaerisporangium perillae]